MIQKCIVCQKTQKENPLCSETVDGLHRISYELSLARIPEFIELLDASKAIHLKKNQDYANASNPFSNFERSAELISWFSHPVDKSFIALIGTKLARIAELSDGREVQKESLDDSFLDLVTYCGLWGSYVKRRNKSV